MPCSEFYKGGLVLRMLLRRGYEKGLSRRHLSSECKVLIFLRISSFDSHALCILSAGDLGDFSPQRNRTESSAHKMYRACDSKDQTLQKIRTLHFPELRRQKHAFGEYYTFAYALQVCRVKAWGARGRSVAITDPL